VTLKRADSFPAEIPIPELPKGPIRSGRPCSARRSGRRRPLRDGFAYVGTGGGVFHAVSLADGKIVWTFPAGKPIHGEALATDDAVFFVCDIGFLYKLDRKTGAEVWRYDLEDSRVPRVLPHPFVDGFDHASPRPTLADGVIYVGSGDGGLHAVDPASGKRIWRFATSGKVRTDAYVAGPTVYATSLDHNVYAVDRKTGKEEWRKGPALRDHELAARRRGQAPRRHARQRPLRPRLEKGDILWRGLFWGSWVESTPVPWSDKGQDKVYIGSSDERAVSCYDPKDGRLVWRADVFGWAWGRPVVTEKLVYAAVGGVAPYPIRHVGGLCAIDRESGRMLWRRPVDPPAGRFEYGFAAGPALLGDLLVVGDLDGNLFAFPVET
jgi:outer membrane protein assembly factor BamB